MSAGDKLPKKRKKFAECLVSTAQWNASEAYRQAGYKASSESTASTGGHKLVSNGDVKSYIDDLIARSGITKRITPEVLKTVIFDVITGTKDDNTRLRATEQYGRALAMFKDVSRVEEAGSAELLASLKGQVPDEVLATMAEEHGIDLDTLGISKH